MTRVLVTGTRGQVAQTLVARASSDTGIEVVALGRPEFDLTEPGNIAARLAELRPDVVVNAAAYTAVDDAETNAEIALQINGHAAGELAQATAELRVPLVQISTDYVFDGTKHAAYTEDDRTGPINMYGRSKLLGEERVRAGNDRHVILRTSWIYGPYGKNFLKTVIRLSQEQPTLRIVSDRVGTPTSARTVADGVLTVVRRLQGPEAHEVFGTFHLAGPDEMSWHGFASLILEELRNSTGQAAELSPTTSAEYVTKARRPANSGLSSRKFQGTFGYSADPVADEIRWALAHKSL